MFGIGKKITEAISHRITSRDVEDNSIDVSLMEASGQGDDYSFQSLVERHQQSVINTVYKMLGPSADVDDIAQQVFLRLWKSAPKYRPRAKFTTFLFTIVRNVVFTESKRLSKRQHTAIEDSDNPEILSLSNDKSSNPDEAVAMAELQEKVDHAIAKLPEDQRMAVVLRRYENMPYEDIASVLNTTVSAVKSLLFRARTSLKESLASYLEENRQTS